MLETRIVPAYPKIDFGVDPVTALYISDLSTDGLVRAALIETNKLINQTERDFIPVVIDSWGGPTQTLFALVDVLRSSGKRIVTICEGKAMSAGAVLFSCGVERYVGAEATIMVHDVTAHLIGKEPEIRSTAEWVTRLNAQVYRLLDENTGKRSGYWRALVKQKEHAELFLSAQEAKRRNLATHIGIPYVETTVTVKSRLRRR